MENMQPLRFRSRGIVSLIIELKESTIKILRHPFDDISLLQ